MIRRIWLLFIAVFVFAVCLEAQIPCKEKANPYRLPLIQCQEQYDSLCAADPEMRLVDLEEYIPGIVLDIHYATKYNFTFEVIYTQAKAFLRQPVADALRLVQDSLASMGYGLKVFDAYRPYAASLRFFEVYPDSNFVANPRYGSRHNRGCAVDVTLIRLKDSTELDMPTDYDDFSERAGAYYLATSPDRRYNRGLLIDVMEHFDFRVHPSEWWHFDYMGWDQFPLMDLSFEELEGGR